MTRFLFSIIPTALALQACGLDSSVPSTEAARPDKHVIYVSAGGRDSNLGTSSAPLQSIAGAQRKLARLWKSKGAGHSSIYIKPGQYRNQNAVWTLADPRYRIRIWGIGETPRKTVFNGSGSTGNFLSVKVEGRSNLHLKNFTITRYLEGVTFSGRKRGPESKKNSGNKIERLHFVKIGNAYFNESRPAYAVLRFVSSGSNTVVGNVFSHNISDFRGSLLHSIYIAHESSDNKITSNKFSKASGDAIRIRDFSNNNRIVGNSFADLSNFYAVATWHDAKDAADPECSSINNIFKGNMIGAETRIWINHKSIDDRAHCKRPNHLFAGKKQIRTMGNTTTSSGGNRSGGR